MGKNNEFLPVVSRNLLKLKPEFAIVSVYQQDKPLHPLELAYCQKKYLQSEPLPRNKACGIPAFGKSPDYKGKRHGPD